MLTAEQEQNIRQNTETIEVLCRVADIGFRVNGEWTHVFAMRNCLDALAGIRKIPGIEIIYVCNFDGDIWRWYAPSKPARKPRQRKSSAVALASLLATGQ